MVASGLVSASPENPCLLVAKMALDMRSSISKLNLVNDEMLDIRIGIHMGAVIAGVIGLRKFNYDIWGDTVNTASRMESHGEAGKIHVSETVYHQLKDSFELNERGLIEIKGKGKMLTYFLMDIQDKSLETP